MTNLFALILSLALASVAFADGASPGVSNPAAVGVVNQNLDPSEIYQRLRERLNRTTEDGHWLRYRNYTVSAILVEALDRLTVLTDGSWPFAREVIVRSVARDMYSYIAMLPPDRESRTPRDLQIVETSRVLKCLVEQKIAARVREANHRRAIFAELGGALVEFVDPETAPALHWWARNPRPSPAASNPEVTRGVVIRLADEVAADPFCQNDETPSRHADSAARSN